MSLLVTAFICLQAAAQLSPAIFIIPMLPRQQVSIFKAYPMDSSYSLVGIQPGRNGMPDSAELCFLVDNPYELQNIKKEWKVSQPVASVFDPTVVQLFLLKNKKVVTTWNIFPHAHTIITSNGMYQFNLDRLMLLTDSHPLHYRKQVDTFYTIATLKHFSDSISMSPAFIFSEPTHFSFEGSFFIQPTDNSMPTELTEQGIARICEKNLKRDSYSIYKKAGDQAGQAMQVYVIKCSKQGYEKFPEKEFSKGEWQPGVQSLISYWKAD